MSEIPSLIKVSMDVRATIRTISSTFSTDILSILAKCSENFTSPLFETPWTLCQMQDSNPTSQLNLLQWIRDKKISCISTTQSILKSGAWNLSPTLIVFTICIPFKRIFFIFLLKSYISIVIMLVNTIF
jgi:hypothetical protein